MVEAAEEFVKSVRGRQVLVEVAEVILPELPGGVPQRLQQLGNGRVLGLQADVGPGTPTLLMPVRYTLCPVMNDDRPAVQLCSPYESVNRIPSSAIRSMFGVR